MREKRLLDNYQGPVDEPFLSMTQSPVKRRCANRSRGNGWSEDRMSLQSLSAFFKAEIYSEECSLKSAFQRLRVDMDMPYLS